MVCVTCTGAGMAKPSNRDRPSVARYKPVMMRRYVSVFQVLGDFLCSSLHDILWSFAKYNLCQLFKLVEH